MAADAKRGLPLLGTVASASRLLGVRVALPYLMHRHALDAVLQRLTPPEPSAEPGAGAEDIGRVLARVEAVLRWLPLLPATCLYKSLGRYSVLRHAGVPARFVMGLRPGSAEPLGHAWVEVEGRPWQERPDPLLVETFSYPPRAK